MPTDHRDANAHTRPFLGNCHKRGPIAKQIKAVTAAKGLLPVERRCTNETYCLPRGLDRGAIQMRDYRSEPGVYSQPHR